MKINTKIGVELSGERVRIKMNCPVEALEISNDYGKTLYLPIYQVPELLELINLAMKDYVHKVDPDNSEVKE